MALRAVAASPASPATITGSRSNEGRSENDSIAAAAAGGGAAWPTITLTQISPAAIVNHR
jgi:hypothetical protein